jgi:hypothetical protein
MEGSLGANTCSIKTIIGNVHVVYLLHNNLKGDTWPSNCNALGKCTVEHCSASEIPLPGTCTRILHAHQLMKRWCEIMKRHRGHDWS